MNNFYINNKLYGKEEISQVETVEMYNHKILKHNSFIVKANLTTFFEYSIENRLSIRKKDQKEFSQTQSPESIDNLDSSKANFDEPLQINDIDSLVDYNFINVKSSDDFEFGEFCDSEIK